MLNKTSYFLIRTSTTSLKSFPDNLNTLIGLGKKRKELLKKIDAENTALILYISGRVAKTDSSIHRKSLINLKRKLKHSKNKLLDVSDCGIDKILDMFLERRNNFIKSVNEVEKSIETTIKSNVIKSHKLLKEEVKQNVFFYNALVMDSSFEMVHSIHKLVNSKDSSNKGSRHIEETVKNYLNRMVKKPSPLSTFAKVSIEVSNLPGEKKISEQFSTPVARLNEIIFKILEEQISNNLAFKKDWSLFINPTMTVDSQNNYVYFVRSDMSDPQALYNKESILKVKRNKLITYLLELFKNSKFLSYKIVLNHIYDVTGDLVKGEKILLFLITKGILGTSLGFDDQNLHKFDKLITIFQSNPDKQFKRCSHLLSDLKGITVEINSQYGNIQKKIHLKLEALEKVKSIFAFFNLSLKQENINFKNIYYENNVEKSVLSDKHDNERNCIGTGDLDKIISFYQLFDDSLIGRLVLKNSFLKEHNLFDKVPLISFFDEWENSNLQEGKQTLQNMKELTVIKKLRERFFEHLESLLGEQDDFVEDIYIDDNWFNSFAKEIKKVFQPLKSFGVYYQLTDNDDVVINNIAPGYGRHFFRYAIDLPNLNLDILRKAYKKMLDHSSVEEKLADIGSTVGLNINLHPEVLKNVIAYPGSSIPVNPSQKILKGTDLYIQINKKNGLLEIVNDAGVHIEPAPMGFLFSKIAPKFYEFIMSFSENNGIKVNFWDRFYQWKANKRSGENQHFPAMLVLGRYMINRETWYIKARKHQRSSYDVNSINFSYLSIVELLRSNHFCANDFFAKMSLEIDALMNMDENGSDWIKKISVGKLRKPQYYNIDNYLDLRNFELVLDNDNIISIQPSVPSTNYSEEYLAEFFECGH